MHMESKIGKDLIAKQLRYFPRILKAVDFETG